MRWYKKLYVGPSVVDRKKIQKKAALGMGMVGVYYITLASLPGNLLDIFHNGMLKLTMAKYWHCLLLQACMHGLVKMRQSVD